MSAPGSHVFGLYSDRYLSSMVKRDQRSRNGVEEAPHVPLDPHFATPSRAAER